MLHHFIISALILWQSWDTAVPIEECGSQSPLLWCLVTKTCPKLIGFCTQEVFIFLRLRFFSKPKTKSFSLVYHLVSKTRLFKNIERYFSSRHIVARNIFNDIFYLFHRYSLQRKFFSESYVCSWILLEFYNDSGKLDI